MATDTPLFDLSTVALAEWLADLSTLPTPQAAHRLNQALKQLREQDTDPELLSALLYNLTPLTLHFSASLSAAAITETDPSSKALKLAKLSMQLPRQLALMFCRLSKSLQSLPSALQTCLYYALQLIGHSFRCYALFYEMPSPTLWKKSADLYKLAVSYESLSSPQATKLAEFKAQTTIQSLIKRNLLFSILPSALYKAEEINHFFEFANQYADLLDIDTSQDAADFGFYWDLEKDRPPQAVKKNNRSLPSGCMAINSRRLSQALQSGSLTTKLSPSTQNKLVLLLSSYRQVFESVIPGPPSRTTLVPGFTAACHYLQELNKLIKINQLSAQIQNNKDAGPALSLMPLEHQRNVFDAVDTPFSKPSVVGKSVNILKTPNKNYCVAESRTLDCATGDIVLLYKEQHPVSIGIIRQQQFNELSNAPQLLLELIPGNCTIYGMGDNAIDISAIVIGENSDQAQVVLASGRYNLFTPITLSIHKTLTLTACLESNQYFARFRFR